MDDVLPMVAPITVGSIRWKSRGTLFKKNKIIGPLGPKVARRTRCVSRRFLEALGLSGIEAHHLKINKNKTSWAFYEARRRRCVSRRCTDTGPCGL